MAAGARSHQRLQPASPRPQSLCDTPTAQTLCPHPPSFASPTLCHADLLPPPSVPLTTPSSLSPPSLTAPSCVPTITDRFKLTVPTLTDRSELTADPCPPAPPLACDWGALSTLRQHKDSWHSPQDQWGYTAEADTGWTIRMYVKPVGS